ncbi:uncharacterized protein [Dermacentor andersoni]|uniref:uncharacterized protein n=1 Tax=Dermacentor andersoni TaxID=34620 RepID=UPI003B3B90F2
MAASSPEAKTAERQVAEAVPLAGALVPVGGTPVHPVHVPPADDYEDEPEDLDDGPAKQHKHALQAAEHRPSLTLIFGLAVAVITLAAVVTFYEIQPGRHDGTKPPSVTTTSAFPNSSNAAETNVTQDGKADGSAAEEASAVI